jgi:nucleoside-diphosphate-sugar epimerase
MFLGIIRESEKNRQMKKVLVTGGSGFIGSAIVKRLLLLGCKVTVLDDNSRGSFTRLQDVMDQINFVVGSIEDIESVRLACEGNDLVVHLAYINGTKNFYDRPGDVLNVGIRGMLNLCDVMTELGIPDLMLASSSEVYQEASQIPTPEEVSMVVPDLTNPRYSYGLGKIVQEFYGFHAMKNLERFVIFRPHNIYGPNMGNLHVVPQLIEKCRLAISLGKPLEIEGDGSQTRSFCYIDDFVDVFELLFKGAKHRNVYNIGTSEEISIHDLSRLIARSLGFDGEIITSKGPIGGTIRRLPSIDKIQLLGFSQKVEIKDGIKLCIEGEK